MTRACSSWRAVFYLTAALGSTFLSILTAYKTIDKDSAAPNQGFPGFQKDDSIKQIKPQLKPKPLVTAPWTKLERNGDVDYPRSFIFSDPGKMGDYGLRVGKFDKKQQSYVKNYMESRLCSRVERLSGYEPNTAKCEKTIEILKCSSCSELDGAWYSLSSMNGAVFGHVDIKNNVMFPNYNDGPFMHQQLDIAVPISGQDEKLGRFAARLGPTIDKFRNSNPKIAIRLLITRFQSDEKGLSKKQSEDYRKSLKEMTRLGRPGDDVVFVRVDNPEFNRAKAVNALHRAACSRDNCAIAVTDVDMDMAPKFLRNALIFAFPGASAYFPIMWSQYNPDTVSLADSFLPQSAQVKHSDHHGYWRKASYGMYVIAGSDALRLTMDEGFVGWGGEDGDFYKRVAKSLNVVRLHETGLTHVWHAKDCKLGSFVENNFYKDCVSAMSHTEGSQLGLYLRNMRNMDRLKFDKMMRVASNKMQDLDEYDSQEYNSNILVAVISSRENFKTRAASIMGTWGSKERIPDGVEMRFFVGAAEPSSGIVSGSEEDISNLAAEAGITDKATIVVMSNVTDNEYPPVRKNSAMIENLERVVSAFENDPVSPTTFQWVFKVDDDAYVNFNALVKFIRTRNPEGYSVYGERGTGRPEDIDGLTKGGLVEPYCTGGPGYILSRPALRETAAGMNACVENADKSDYRDYLWHSDVVIGMCVYQQTGAKCWNDDDYMKRRVFKNNFKKEYPFIEDHKLPNMVSMHPFKDVSSMLKQHLRYMKLEHMATSIQ